MKAHFLGFLSLKRKPVAEVSDAATRPILPPAQSSPLLKHVLGEEAAATNAVTESHEKKNGASVLSERLSVGARLADAKRRTLEAAEKIIALSDAVTGQAIRTLIEDLEKSVCCIAFAGQMKAGKSSLINVLVEEPGLLPADINPWTTVITRLHFGGPGKPRSGASFTTFTQDEWQRLSIGGRTRELTERLFPDFDWQALKSHVDAMQERARRKLGDRFEELLGTQHTYPEITPGLLNRYVGAGHDDAQGPTPGAEGEFSDITKLADVFLDVGAFNFPTILIDTPGVNDPFLVRDEITRQNLQAADICVIVLTARQPISTADLSLLRMLRGLKKERLIIFINKIDEINGGETVLRELSHRVAAILKQEFPSARIPIVFGSAIWARNALSSYGAYRHKADAAPAEASESAPAQDFAWPSHDEIADTVAAETFFLKSGLTSLAVAISELMRGGPIADTIGATSSLLETVCGNLILWLETEADVLGKIPADINAARQELEALIALREGLATEIDAFSERLAAISNEKAGGLHQQLAEMVQLSVAEFLADTEDDALAARASKIDARLRLKLEGVFLAGIEDVSKLIAEEQERLRTALAALFEAGRLRDKPEIIVGRPLAMSPSLAALSEPAALGLGASLGEFAAPAESQSEYLSRVILSDFEPIMDKLAGEAARCFHESSANLAQQVRALTLSPLDISIERISAAIREAAASAAGNSAISQSMEQKVHALREVISGLQLVLARKEPSFPPKSG